MGHSVSTLRGVNMKGVNMKKLLVILGIFCLGNALELELGPELVGEEENIFKDAKSPRMVRKVAPRHACGALEAFPYFKAKDLTAYKDSMVPKQEVNKFKFMVELSRFINGKAPALLQEFAQNKKIFTVKKKIAQVENEAIFRQKLFEHQTRFVRSTKDKPQFSKDFVKTMTTECARLMTAIAKGMKEVESRTDPNAQLFVRALSTCGQFMTSLSIEMQRRMQKVEGFRSLPLDLPYEDDVTFVKDALEKVSGEKTFVETLQEQDAKSVLRACMVDNAADVCTEANMIGLCNDDGTCMCDVGFTGDDCSEEVPLEPVVDGPEETDEEETDEEEESVVEEVIHTVEDAVQPVVDVAKPVIEQVAELGTGVVSAIIDVFNSTTSTGFEFVNELIEGVGDVIESAFSGSTHWNLICLATWWPLQEEHCRAARCAVCSPGVLSAMSICKSAYQRVDHKCVQEVMGEGFCNYCIADFIA